MARQHPLGSRTEPCGKDTPAVGTNALQGKHGAVGSCLSALASPMPAGRSAWPAPSVAKAQPRTSIPSARPRPGCLLAAGLALLVHAAQERTVPLPLGTSWEQTEPCLDAFVRTGCPDAIIGPTASPCFRSLTFFRAGTSCIPPGQHHLLCWGWMTCHRVLCASLLSQRTWPQCCSPQGVPTALTELRGLPLPV